MFRSKAQKRAQVRESLDAQNEILGEFGEEAVEKARQRLCARCSEMKCPLLPLCLDGGDCPYFKLKEVEA